MRIEQLEYVAAVTQHGSLRRASERLHISQPALSEAVTKLERELGVTLLDRKRSGARISRQGVELLQNMADVLEAVDRLRQAAGDQHTITRTVRIGTVSAPDGVLPQPADAAAVDDSPVRCFDPAASAAMVDEIDRTRRDGDTLGGVVEVLAYGLPPGLGSFTHGDRRLDAKLAGALMGIQAIKGVEVGDGFELAATPGSLAHDEMVPTEAGIRRVSARSGGTEGGMTTGEVLRVRAAMKPIATVPRALRTVDVATGEEAVAHHQRSDVCAVPAAGIVAEAMVALVLADAVLEKFGGDSVGETRRNVETYLAALPDVLQWSGA